MKLIFLHGIFIPQVIIKKKSSNTTFKMETVLTNAYTHMDKKSRVFKTNSIAIGTKELLQTSKTFFLQNGAICK